MMEEMASANNESSLDELSYEDAMEKLEKIIVTLEEGEVSLDSLVYEYRAGKELLKYCRAKVDTAEIQINEVEAIGNQGGRAASDA